MVAAAFFCVIPRGRLPDELSCLSPDIARYRRTITDPMIVFSHIAEKQVVFRIVRVRRIG
jgi:hypothetical protein